MTIATDWRGAVGDVWAEEWRRTDRSFGALATALDGAIQRAAPAERGTVLDIGCGAGATSIALATARPDLTVIGLDISAELVDVARDRAERASIANARFATADLDRALLDVPAPELIVSRHGVMFSADPIVMFARLHALARPGAGLVFSCFRAVMLNAWASDLLIAVTGNPPPPADGRYAPGPFAFADPEYVTDLLATAGWREMNATPVDYDYVAGAGADPVADAASYLSRIGPVATAMRGASGGNEGMRARLAAELARHSDGNRVAFPAAAWLWSAIA